MIPGVYSFRKRFIRGKPNQAAIRWGLLKGLCDSTGKLTEAGERWISPRGSALRTMPPSRTPLARKAGGTRALKALQVRSLLAGGEAGGGGPGRDLPAEGSAHEREGGDAGLRESSTGDDRGLARFTRDWRASTVWDRTEVDREAVAEKFRSLRVENARRNGLGS